MRFSHSGSLCMGYLEGKLHRLPFWLRWSIWFVRVLLFCDWRWARNRIVMVINNE